jgi:dipeptidyl aminopeptidase/acylaminoacyl peptidase
VLFNSKTNVLARVNADAYGRKRSTHEIIRDVLNEGRGGLKMRRRSGVLLRVAYAALLVCSSGAWQNMRGQQQSMSVDQAIDTLVATRAFSEVAISPDGAKVAWSVATLDRNNTPTGNSAIYVAASRGGAESRISAGDGAADYAEHDIAWSPDGNRLAFLSDKGSPGQLQLYVADAGRGGARKLTALVGLLATPQWSPDGKAIAFLFTENATQAAGPTQAAAAPAGLIEEQVDEQRLAIVDLATGKVRQVTPADLYIYDYDWSPDGARFVATAAHGSGDNNWFIAQLYNINVATGETTSILKPAMQIEKPRFSPDGRSIAFIGGLMSDEGVTGGDIYVIPSAGGEARDLTSGMKASASWLAWTSSGAQILFTEHTDGGCGAATLDLASGRIAEIWKGDETITQSSGVSLSLARDGKTSAVIRHTFTRPPEVWAGETGAWRQLTHANANLKPGWGEAKSLHWTSDGQRVQGWLLYPQNFDPSRKYPMVVVIHGGPSSQLSPRWGSGLGLPLPLASAGNFLFFPNPRGSYGQGEEFTRANVKDFGGGDLRDILAGVSEVLRSAPVDEKRIGVTGWSYGGYMTMFAVTQTNRFRAAAAGAGIANWQSYYGENQIDQWMIPFFGASVYDDPAVYAKSAPITFIKNVKTPTLVLVGDRDKECPAPQSFEFWHALKSLGVPTQLMIYAGEGHAISQPAHRRDVLKRSAAWFDQYLR